MTARTSQNPRGEPIAVVGAGCRFPGDVSSPSELWNLLSRPRDVLTEIPTSRFSADGFYHPEASQSGHANVIHAYTLSGEFRAFDADFFNISAAEAAAMDLQQRLLLECVFEAIEDGGMRLGDLRGSDTAVYVGLMMEEYSTLQLRDVNYMPTYYPTGTSRAVVSNRISYAFDWRGPSMTIDTACSSSLVAVHHAVQTLRAGTSRVAVAAGANLLLGPEPFIYESTFRMLSPQGRSQMWDEKADGYARGEGIAAVILKRLSDAIADGDHIECVIRETGVNQDGRTKGITVPSADAQAALIRDTYRRAGLDLASKEGRPQFFEAHGTGTQAGDPVEAEAIHRAIGQHINSDQGQSKDPETLLVGSIKTIVGHTEGTAGVAGLLKVMLALKHGVVPPNLLFQKLNKAIEPFYGGLEVPTQTSPWPSRAPGQPRRASLNSFGFGGTNAHAIVESYEPQQSEAAPSSDPKASQEGHSPFVFSAPTKTALRANLQAVSQFLRSSAGAVHPADLVHTFGSRRSIFPLRAAFSAQTVQKLGESIQGSLDESDWESALVTCASTKPTRTIGIFTGQGAQWVGMGCELVQQFPFLLNRLQELEAVLSSLPVADRPKWSLSAEILDADKTTSQLSTAAVSQPVCTAIQIMLVDALNKAGVTLDAVVGHSSGEIAVAYASGLLTARDALLIAYYRGFHCSLAGSPEKPGQKGAMMAVGTTLEDAEEICGLPEFEGRLCVAAHNSPTSVTLSGDYDAVEEARLVFEDEGKFARLLRVDTAYHSHHMLPCAQPYETSLRESGVNVITPHGGPVWFSSVHNGYRVDVESSETIQQLQATYWCKNMTQAVTFSAAVEAAVYHACADGHDIIAIEIGPHHALQKPFEETLAITKHPDALRVYSSCLVRNQHASETFAACLGDIWKHHPDGGNIKFSELVVEQTGQAPKPVKGLPLYSWDHSRIFWHESRASRTFRTRPLPGHPLLGTQSPTFTERDLQWTNVLRLSALPWLAGHQLQGQTVFPAAGYVVLAMEAAMKLAPNPAQVQLLELEDVSIDRAIALSDADGGGGIETIFTLHVDTHQEHEVTASFTFHTGVKDSTSLNLNAQGRVRLVLASKDTSVSLMPSRGAAMAPGMVEVDEEHFYTELQKIGYNYSGSFRALRNARRKMGQAMCVVERPRVSDMHLSERDLLVHPGLLDSAFQSGLLAQSWPGDGAIWSLYVPTSIKRMRIDAAFFRGTRTASATDFDTLLDVDATISEDRIRAGLTGQVDISSPSSGRVVVQIEDIAMVPFAPATAESDVQMFFDSVLDVAWPDAELVAEGKDESEANVAAAWDLERIAYYYARVVTESITPEEEKRAAPHFRKFLAFARHVVGETRAGRQKYCKKEWGSDTWTSIQPLLARNAELADLRLLRAVGDNIVAAVRSTGSDTETGSSMLLEHMMRDGVWNDYYQSSIGIAPHTAMLAEVMAQIAHRAPSARILEVGAGSGGATKLILPRLGQAFAEYTFTDSSAAFFGAASERFASFKNRLVLRVLDVEKDIATQGFQEGEYDVVVASLVIHATADLSDTLANVRKLLRPGGWLVMLEITSSESIRMSMTFGGLPGWWLGADSGRPWSPGLSPAEWHGALLEAGFSGIETVTPETNTLVRPVSVIVSRSLDERVSLLIEPSSEVSPLSTIGHLVIITGNGLAGQRMARSAASLLKRHASSTTTLRNLEDFSRSFSAFGTSGPTVLSLAELDRPVLEWGFSDETFEALKTVLLHTSTMLWVTRGRHSGDNPSTSILTGMGRVIRNEFARDQLRLQFLDLDPAFTSGSASVIVEELLRLQILAKLEEEGTHENLLWSREPETVVGDDRRMRVPRLVASQRLNDAYNSTRRRVVSTVGGGDGIEDAVLTLTPAGDGGHPASLVATSPSKPSQGQAAIRVLYTGMRSLVGPGGHQLHLCIGEEVETGRAVLAAAGTMSSTVQVDKKLMVPYDGHLDAAAASFLATIITGMVASTILQDVGKTTGAVALLDAPTSISATLRKQAVEKDLQLLSIRTTEAASEPDRDSGGSSHFLHPLTTTRGISQLLAPMHISHLVSFGASNGGVLQRLKDALPGVSILDHSADNGACRADGAEGACTGASWAPELTRIAQMAVNATRLVPAKVVAPQQATEVTPAQGVPEPWATVVHWAQEQTVPVVVRPPDETVTLRGNGTYLLFGLAASGGLGFSLVEWMVRQGARNIVLTSRNPKPDADWISSLEAQGVRVEIVSNDITDREAVESLVNRIRDDLSWPPIAGVANGAMVLHDTPLAQMTPSQFRRVLAPKVDGTRILDDIFLQGTEQLDFFVLFSSLATVVGNPGQSNYAAANSYMAAMAARRRRQSLAASILDLGLVVGVGYVTRQGDARVFEKLEKAGCRRISERDFHVAFASAVLAGTRREGDGEVICGLLVGGEGPGASDVVSKTNWADNPIFSHVVGRRVVRAAADRVTATASARELLQTANSKTEATKIVQDALIQKLVTTLQLAPEVAADRPRLLAQPPEDLGVDSLVAVEIRAWLLREFEVDILVLNLIVSGSVAEIADTVVERLPGALVSSVGQAEPDTVESAVQVSTFKQQPPIGPSASLSPKPTPEDTAGSAGTETSATSATFTPPSSTPSPPPAPSPLPGHFTPVTHTGSASEPAEVEPSLVTPQAPLATPKFVKVVPMSFGQSDFWFMTQLATDKTLFNGTVSFVVRGSLDPGRLARAVQALGARHEGLRTALFEDEQRRQMQGVLAESPLRLETRHISSLEEVEECQRAMNLRVFDFGKGESVLMTLLTRSPTEHHLVMGYHHINVDASTFLAIVTDLRRIYAGDGARLPEPLQYTTFSQQQVARLESGAWDKSIAFWKAEFPTIPDVLPILKVVSPARGQSRNRPVRRTSYRHVKSEGRISADLASGIRAMARRYKVTPFHIYTSVLQVLLARLGGNTDVVVGMADANRSDDGAAGAVGIFVNVLPLRLATPMTTRFSDLLRQTRAKIIAAMAHASLPFDVILKVVGVERSAAHSPLFQAFVNYLPVPERLPFADTEFEHGEYRIGETVYDIMLNVIDKPAGDAFVSVLLQKELYDTDNAETVAGCFLSLLEAFVGDDTLRAGEATMWDATRVDTALALGTGPELDLGNGSLLQDLDAIAALHPNFSAVRDSDGLALTYQELMARGDAIASTLQRLGIKTGSRVAVLQEPTADWICSMLGVWGAGASYVPLEVSQGVRRLSVVSADADAEALVVHDATSHLVTEIGWKKLDHVVNVSQFLPEANTKASSETPSERQPILGANDEAIVLYTSGSTGVPKGISLPHRMITNTVRGFLAHWKLGPQTILQQIPLSFDVSWWQSLLALATGGTVVVAGRRVRKDPLALTTLIKTQNVTLTMAVPSETRSWLTFGDRAALHTSSWNYHISAGEDFGPALLRQLRELGKPDLKAMNAYGPAETIVPLACDVDYHSVSTTPEAVVVPIGRVMPNYSVRIVDSQGHPVPAGIVGQIVIAGAGVATGYVNRAEQTAEKFPLDDLASPRALEMGWSRAHLSGDEGYLREDGHFVMLGRIAADTQVNLRGQRLDLREVESCIVSSSRGEVQDAVVHLHQPREGPEASAAAFLVARVVLAPEARKRYDSPEKVRKFLDLITSTLPLPDYMRPALALPLDMLPLSPHGKVDRKAVAAMPLEATDGPTSRGTSRVNGNSSTRSHRAADDLAVAHMRDAWVSVLGDTVTNVREIRGDSDFFDVGGNSLLMVTLQSELKTRFGLHLELAELFETSTLSQMAGHLAGIPRLSEKGDPIVTKLRELWMKTLGDHVTLHSVGGHEAITEEADFFQLGGNSLLLVTLQAEVNKELGVNIPLAQLFEATTLGQMADLVRDKKKEPWSGITSNAKVIDWEAETDLGPDLDLILRESAQQEETALSTTSASEPGGLVVVLTGASGFLGRSILRALSQQTHGRVRKVHCVAVRNPPKLAAAVEDLALSESASLVTIHPGNLADPSLGLSEATARAIFSEADAVIHNGADVSFMRTFASLRAANVSSTRNLAKLMLAHRRGRPANMHYISTAGVSALGTEELYEEPVNPSLVDDAAENKFSGYTLTKWVSERLLEKLATADRSARLRITVHRPASVTGPDANRLDALHNVLHFVRELRRRPDIPPIERWLQLVDVEDVAARVVADVVGRGIEAVPVSASHETEAGHDKGAGGGGMLGGASRVVVYRNLCGKPEEAVHISHLHEEPGMDVPVVPMADWIGRALERGMPREVAEYLQATGDGGGERGRGNGMQWALPRVWEGPRGS